MSLAEWGQAFGNWGLENYELSARICMHTPEGNVPTTLPN